MRSGGISISGRAGWGSWCYLIAQTYLCTLRKSMADRKLGHIIPLLPQRDKVIVYPRLVLPRIIKVELFRLNVIFAQLLLLELRYLLKKALFFLQRHAPDYHNAVLEEEHLRYVDCGVEVGRYRPCV